MSSLQARFFSPVDINGPVESAYPTATETIAVSASNQITTASAQTNQTIGLTAWGGAVKVAIGTGSPDATSATTVWIVPDGATLYLGRVKLGTKVAAVDA
jgi:Ca2+/Na+ antiporter